MVLSGEPRLLTQVTAAARGHQVHIVHRRL